MPRLAAPHDDNLLGTKVFIFGGTSGIGAAVSSAAAAAGVKVFISSSNPTNIAAAVKHLQSTYPDTTIGGAPADLSDPTTIEANIKSVLDAAVKEFGSPLDHIVYTAGDNLLSAGLAEVTTQHAMQGWPVRYFGPLMVGKLVAANPGVYLKPQSSSSITLTSGILNHKPRKGLGAAVNWGGATETLGRGLAVELAPIRANTVAPGAIATELLEKYGPLTQQFADASILKEVGTPRDIAEAYLFCMRCAFYTSQVLTVDGGFTFGG